MFQMIAFCLNTRMQRVRHWSTALSITLCGTDDMDCGWHNGDTSFMLLWDIARYSKFTGGSGRKYNCDL